MRALIVAAACIGATLQAGSADAAGPAADVAGTYELLICDGPCSFAHHPNALVRGSLVLFADALGPTELQGFDENRLLHHHGEALNGCFTLEGSGTSSSRPGIDRVGLTSWSEDGGRYGFALFHSPDAGYEVTVTKTRTGLAGTGAFWAAGAAAPTHPRSDIVLARRTGRARLSRCTFQTAEEHELRRLLADPARNEMFAIEDRYRRELISALRDSASARDRAMAGWLQNSAQGEAEILRALNSAPDDPLIRWMTALGTHARPEPVGEPGNALWSLRSLREAVDRNDAAATDAALERTASSDHYDDHAAELLRAQLEVYRAHPLPKAYFAAVARLDPGWRLNGAFTEASAPYYENHYPWAMLGIGNLIHVSIESGMQALYAACVPPSGRSAARKEVCLRAARALAAGARRAKVREEAAMLLSAIDDFSSDDVRRARVQQWIDIQFDEILHPRNAGSRLAFVSAEMAFIDDWIQSSDECQAMRRTVLRAGRSLDPPADFRLDETGYGNFEKGS